jgi:hypothetical protein
MDTSSRRPARSASGSGQRKALRAADARRSGSVPPHDGGTMASRRQPSTQPRSPWRAAARRSATAHRRRRRLGGETRRRQAAHAVAVSPTASGPPTGQTTAERRCGLGVDEADPSTSRRDACGSAWRDVGASKPRQFVGGTSPTSARGQRPRDARRGGGRGQSDCGRPAPAQRADSANRAPGRNNASAPINLSGPSRRRQPWFDQHPAPRALFCNRRLGVPSPVQALEVDRGPSTSTGTPPHTWRALWR